MRRFITFSLSWIFCLCAFAQNMPKGNTTLSSSTSSLSFSYSGEETRFTVSCSSGYKVSSSYSWLHVYNYGDYIRVVCDQNYSSSSRSGSILVESTNGAKSLSVSVYQYGKPSNTLSLSSQSVTDDGSGGTLKITVSTNASYWGVKNLPSWCSYKDKTSNSFTLVVNQNSSSSSRSASFIVYAGDTEKTISVEQKGGVGFQISPASLKFSYAAESKYLYVSCCENWSHSCPDWISLKWVAASGCYIVECKENRGAYRSGYILLTSTSGKYTKSILVSQAEGQKFGYTDFWVDKNSFYVSADGGYYNLGIYGESYVRLSNVWTNSNWLEEENLGNGGRQFHVKKNRTGKERSATLFIRDTRGNTISVCVRQAAY